MEGSTQEQAGTPPAEQRSDDQAAAQEAASLAGTLPEDDRRDSSADDNTMSSLEEQLDHARSWVRELERELGLDVVEEEVAAVEHGVVSTATTIAHSTLAAIHQVLGTLSGPEATRAAALREQLPAVPE
jgi:hypothetical protein